MLQIWSRQFLKNCKFVSLLDCNNWPTTYTTVYMVFILSKVKACFCPHKPGPGADLDFCKEGRHNQICTCHHGWCEISWDVHQKPWNLILRLRNLCKFLNIFKSEILPARLSKIWDTFSIMSVNAFTSYLDTAIRTKLI